MATITATATQLITQTVTVTSASATSSNRAAPQGGVFEGVSPVVYDTKNPVILFIIQAAIVIILTRLIHFPLAKLRQPRVIAEVLTGIILGPSIMGRIPGFTNAIFPTASMPAFALAANIGLMLFLFLVGLEVDLRFLLGNWRIALSVGALGMAIPFGLGGAIAWGLYHQFSTDEGLAPIGFGVYMLFIGVAMAITAFPVLCRILTSLKLLSTPVGVIVLSAGVGNDVVGWILLALCVALVNSGAGLTALWILLVVVGYSLFLTFAIRPAYIWVLRRSGSLSNGPTQSVVALTLLLVFASSFFTAIIGVHAIFGAFMVGLICPHEGGFAIKLTEKIEDLISVLFLPLYFALSGLSTNLGLLDNGITWAYVIGITAIAFFGKIAGGTLASRLNGLVWRESLTIGCLMSCKGLVELIVLNIGLQARILSYRTFTMFVVMALVTTFATTPLTVWLYPPWYQKKLELWKQGKIDWDGNPLQPESDGSSDASDSDAHDIARKILVYLRLDGLPGLFTVMSLLSQPRADTSGFQTSRDTIDKSAVAVEVTSLLPFRPVQVHGLRLAELTERESSVMKVSEIEEYASRDPIIKAFGTFGQARDVSVVGQIAVVPDHSFSGTLTSRARDLGSDMILFPWSETGSMSEYPSMFDGQPADPLSNRQFNAFALETFEKARDAAHVAVFIDKSVLAAGGQKESPITDRPETSRLLSRTTTGVSFSDERHSHGVHFKLSSSKQCPLTVVYRGGPDDLTAVKFALQLAKTATVQLSILRLTTRAASTFPASTQPLKSLFTSHNKAQAGEPAPQTSEPESATTTEDDYEFENVKSSLPEAIRSRIQFRESSANTAISTIQSLLHDQNSSTSETILVVGRSFVEATKRRGKSIAEGKEVADISYHNHAHSSSASYGPRDEFKSRTRPTLGSLATDVLSMVREQTLDVGLIVVQARVKAANPSIINEDRIGIGPLTKKASVSVSSDRED